MPVLLFLWVILITFLSITPADQFSSGIFNIKHLDKAAHFMFYFVFALLLYRILTDYMKTSPTIIIIIAAVIPIVYSGGIELFQEYLTTTREADFFDFLMNIIGATVAVLLGRKLIKYELQKQYIREFS